MEIFDLTRLGARQLAALLLAVVLAAGAAGLVASGGDDTYRGRAIVFASRVLPNDGNVTNVNTVISDLRTAVGLPVVIDLATQAVGAPPDVYEVDTDRPTNTDTVEVIATGPDPDLATDLARQSARTALQLLAQQELDQASAAEDAAVQAADTARQDVIDFTQDNATSDPVTEVAQLEAELLILNDQLTASGLSPVARADLEERIAASQGQLDDLAPLRTEFATLDRARLQAETLVDETTRRRINAEAAVQTAVSDNVIVPLEPVTESKLATVAQAAVAAGALVGLVGLAVVHVSNRRRAGRETATADEAPSIEGTPPAELDDSGDDHDHDMSPWLARWDMHRTPQTTAGPHANEPEDLEADEADDEASAAPEDSAEGESALNVAVPVGTVADIEKWVGDDPQRAEAAILAERERRGRKARRTLIDSLRGVVRAAGAAGAAASPTSGDQTSGETPVEDDDQQADGDGAASVDVATDSEDSDDRDDDWKRQGAAAK